MIVLWFNIVKPSGTTEMQMTCALRLNFSLLLCLLSSGVCLDPFFCPARSCPSYLSVFDMADCTKSTAEVKISSF